MTETSKLYHDLESKCSSLKSAIKLLRECEPGEKGEILALMNEAARDILKFLSELGEEINSGKNPAL